VDHHAEQEAFGIDQNVAFDAHQLVVAIIAAPAAQERLDRLAIDNGCARGGISSSREAGELPQVGMDCDPGAITPPLAEIVIDGLITNDKFCWTRWNALSLSWPRSHPLPRTWRQDPPGAEYAPPGDRMSRHHRGGRYASSPHAPMAPAPSASSSPRRTTALGSRVSVSAAVDSALNADPVRARTGGGRPS
jgi:hypothetical protein